MPASTAILQTRWLDETGLFRPDVAAKALQSSECNKATLSEYFGVLEGKCELRWTCVEYPTHARN
jgi:hypothetical protein